LSPTTDAPSPKDAPVATEPGQPLNSPPTFVSQAVQDLANGEGGSTEPSAQPETTLDKEAKIETPTKSPVKTLAWLALFSLCLGVMVFWSAFAFVHNEPYFYQGLILTLAIVLVSVPTFRFFSLPHRATLAGIGLALALTLTSLYNPEANLFPGISFPALWAFCLLLAWFAVLWAIWRVFGRDKPGVAIFLTCALVYPFLSSGLTLFHGIVSFWSGAEEPRVTLANLNQSPVQITKIMPTFLWPQAIMAILIPLIAALLAFRTQLTMFLTKKVKVSLAPFFAGLAFLILLVPSYLAFTPLSQGTALAKNVRGLYPDADFFYSSRHAPANLTAAMAAATTVKATTPPTADQATAAPLATESPTPPTPEAATLPAADQATPPIAEAAAAVAATQANPSMEATENSPAASSDQAPEVAPTVTAEATDKGAASQVPSSQDQAAVIGSLTSENQALKRDNDALNQQVQVLRNENELLRERLAFSDQLLRNLTSR
jgi:hypothetical protein